MTTYRLYVHLPSSTDFLSALSGSSLDTIAITTTTSFFQHDFGGAIATEANTALFDFFPNLAFDSWVTVGYAPEDGLAQAVISSISSPNQNWPSEFESGNDIVINDEYGGLWYILNDGNDQGLAGPGQRVLIAQLTTDGTVSAQVAGQYFPDFGSGPGGSANGDIDNRFNSTLGSSCPFDANADCNYASLGEDCDGNCIGLIDACGVCNGPGDIYDCGCTNIPMGDCDCDGNQVDALNICGGTCEADSDQDGICDDSEIPGCTDQAACNFNSAATDEDGSCENDDECGVCGGTGIPLGDCDCDGNQVDLLNICGGTCQADSDQDGICDDVDSCIGTVDACGVCGGIGAGFQCGCSNIPEGDCDCNGNQVDVIGTCGGNCPADLDGDGVCDPIGPSGCTYSPANNYDPAAPHDDGSCAFDPIPSNCMFDSNEDGIISVQDLLNFLVVLGDTCE